MTETAAPLGDGSVGEEKLVALMALGCERDDLDFKEYFDLSAQKDKLDLIRHVAAMQSLPNGGYIVVGVDDSGRPSNRLGDMDVKLFDPANLHKAAAPYLPTVRVTAAVHEVDGVTVVLIYVAPPNPPGVPILVKDGQYAGRDGRSKTVFAEGDVLVRRGTQSVRWSPADLPVVLQRWEEHIREDERQRATAVRSRTARGATSSEHRGGTARSAHLAARCTRLRRRGA